MGATGSCTTAGPLLRVSAVVVALLASLALAEAAAACSVCFGGADGPVRQGMNNAILVLLGIVAAVQVGFIALFAAIWRRTRRLRQRRERFHVIQGGAG